MHKVLKSVFCSALLLVSAASSDGIDPELEAATEGREASFGIHMVDDASRNPKAFRIAVERGMTPPGTALLPFPNNKTSLIVAERTRINQDCVLSGTAGLHPETEAPILNFRLNDRCTKLFAKLTSEN